MSKTVCISASGTGNGYALANAISLNFPDVHLICFDMNPPELNATSLICDEYYISPAIRSGDYLAFVEDIFRSKKPSIYFAFIDYEFSLIKALCNKYGVVLAGVSFYSDYTIDNKYEYLKVLSEFGIKIPLMAVEKNRLWNAGKYIVKPKSGFGSNGINIYSSRDFPLAPQYFVQEYFEGREITVDCFYDAVNDVFYGSMRERIEVKSGVCTKARVFYDYELERICYKIYKILKLEGGGCIQFIDSDKGWLVIDVNPRLGAGSSLNSALGNDFFSATAAYYLGLEYDTYFLPEKLSRDHFVVRQYREIVML